MDIDLLWQVFKRLNPLDSLFDVIAEKLGFPVDQVRYVVLLLLSFPLAFILRHVLHPSRTSLTVRYVYSLTLGIYFGCSCFGVQMLILFGIVLVSYLMLIFVPPTIVQRFTMVWAMGCLCACHLYRLITDYGGWHLDFTGPLMVMVQKLTMVAYALHDGKARKESTLNADQKVQRITAPPTVLEYFCYVFNFHSLLAGPSCTLQEFLTFMDGSNFQRVESPDPNSPAKVMNHSKEPSAVYSVVSKFIYSMVSIVLFVYLCSVVTHDDCLNPNNSFRQFFYYATLDCFRIRTRYYFTWLISDSINNLAGLGFNGYDDLGRPRWDLVSNIYPMGLEFPLNFRDVATRWNALTSNWLRRCVYERSLIAPTLVAYSVSALWHGFYPGYYFTFIFFGILTVAARKMRRLVGPYFQSSLPLRWGYHVLTWALTRLCMDYGAMAVEFMWFSAVMKFWGSYYYIPAIVVCVVAFLFPSGKSSAQKRPKSDPTKITVNPVRHDNSGISNGQIATDKKKT